MSSQEPLYLGETARFNVTFRDYDGALFDPDEVSCKAYDQNGEQIGNAIELEPTGETGKRKFFYTVGDDDAPGEYRFVIIFAIGDKGGTAIKKFWVIDPKRSPKVS